MKSILIILFTFLLSVPVLQSQQVASPPFYNDVAALKQKDKASFPKPNSILFTGSSSFTKWTDVQAAFPGYAIVNRAFGGSTLTDLIRYANEVIIPYKPRQIIIYCGDNDLASSDTVTPQVVLTRFTQLFTLIRSKLPLTHIVYVSIKPSPSRERLMPKMVQANILVANFLRNKKYTAFADVYTPMLLSDGKPNPAFFVEDNLHMNAKGYAIWQTVLQPYLLK